MNNLDLKGHRERLRQRFISSGLDSFQDHEVLEFILTYAIPRKDVKPLAKVLLKKFGSLSAVFEAPMSMLQDIPGIGQRAALLLNFIFQLFARYEKDRKSKRRKIRNLEDATEFLRPYVDKPYESLWAVALNSNNEILAVEMIQQGSVNRVSVIPRLIVEMAIKYRATALILSHNHPSGNCSPSESDIKLTEIMKSLLSYLDIVLLDHIIISKSGHYSFAEKNILNNIAESERT